MIRLLTVLFLLAATAVSACTAAGSPRPEIGSYVVRDTLPYENTLTEGTFGVLVVNGEVLDSVDLFFGVHRLNSGALVFLPVVPSPSEAVPDGRDVTEHVLFDGRQRVRLASLLPHFDDYFSSPSVLDGRLFYWGLEQIADSDFRLHAYRYDFLNRQVTSSFLFDAEVATDNRGHFPPPYCSEGKIAFHTHEQLTLFNRDLKLLEAVRPAPPLPDAVGDTYPLTRACSRGAR